ncbi:uncharacterized protein LOC117610585 [Osmia lignaria lignaria]|uniref:uncharacterized protein LOC117610585 n=1 Tax=Osmia lignaria lignaria TaxID=1437193 RepID=UPI00402BA86D
MTLDAVQVSVLMQFQAEREDFSELDASSMSGKIEYLEKYSIAPSPSRDYYGLRVLGDQVILYLWRISHGPHKLPIVRTTSLDNFTQDKSLQDEIRRIFGKYLLRHIRQIASGRRNTLLALPKCLIKRLIRYLAVQDIVKLSSLSHVAKEIFDDNFVWETLYKKYKPLTKRQNERLDFISYDWKRLFQQAQMQGLIKVPRARPVTKQAKPNQKLEDFTKTSNFASRTISKPIPFENQSSKKPVKNVQKKIIQNPIPRKSSDIRLDESIMDKEREKFEISEKKASTIRSLQMSAQKNTKTLKQKSTITRIESKHEMKDSLRDKPSETKLNKTQNKARKIDAKASNISLKTLEEREGNSVKSKSNNSRTTKNERAVSRTIQEDQSKTRTKGKGKKIGQSKSTIFNTATALLDDPGLRSTVKNDCLDLADLIEASLKNMRSPRSILDCNFDKSKFCAGDSAEKITEHSRGLLKNGRANVTLDRLSEKSEPLTAKSVDSVKNDASARSVASKYKTKNKNEFNGTMEFDAYFERYYNKHVVPHNTRESEENKRSILRKTVDKMSVLRSLGTKNSYPKKIGVDSVPQANRYELKKAVGNFFK